MNRPGQIASGNPLLIDAGACMAGAIILLLSRTVWEWTDLPASWREPVVALLFGFAVLLVVAARNQSRSLIAVAVVGNILWVIGGSIALFVSGTAIGWMLIATVMIGDALMAWLQSRQLRAT